jgi:hypothetical protein
MLIELTLGERKKLLDGGSITKEIFVEIDATGSEKVRVRISAVQNRAGMTESQRERESSKSRQSQKKNQDITLAAIEGIGEGRTYKLWAKTDWQELQERVSRGESSTQIGLAMQRTYRSIRAARTKLRAVQ